MKWRHERIIRGDNIIVARDDSYLLSDPKLNRKIRIMLILGWTDRDSLFGKAAGYIVLGKNDCKRIFGRNTNIKRVEIWDFEVWPTVEINISKPGWLTREIDIFIKSSIYTQTRLLYPNFRRKLKDY